MHEKKYSGNAQMQVKGQSSVEDFHTLQVKKQLD